MASLRYAVRRAQRQRGLNVLVALAMALGLGSATAGLALANRALVNPFGLPRPRQLMAIADDGSPPGAAAYSRLPAFVAACGFTTGGLPVTAGLSRGQQYVAAVTAGFFRVTGIEPRHGRRFSGKELRAGERAAVISHDLAVGGYGGAAVGRRITLGGELFTVIGVMPAGFGFPGGTAVWIPARAATSHLVLMDGPAAAGYGAGRLIARLRAGVSIAAASAQVRAQQRREAAVWDAEHPRGPRMGVSDVTLRPLLQSWTHGERGTVNLLLAATGLLFLISCFVMSGVLLARALSSQKEMATRLALGAQRAQLARQWLADALVVVAPAAVIGAGVAAALMAALRGWAPATMPGLDLLYPGWRDAAALLALAAVALVLTALPPALSTLRLRPPGEMLQSAFFGRVRASRLWPVLVTLELAVALALTTSAALLLASFGRLTHVDLGFSPAGVQSLTFTSAPGLVPLLNRDRSEAAVRAGAINRAVLAAAQRVPGAEVALASNPPLTRYSTGGMFVLPLPGSVRHEAGAEPNEVSGSYFQLLEIPLLRGRTFAATDGTGAPLVAIVSQRLAHRFWGDQNPIGRRIAFDGDTAHPRRVVGEVGEVLAGGPVDLEGWAGQIYLPLAQPYRSRPVATLLARTGKGAAAEGLAAALQTVPGVEVLGSSSLSAAAARATAPQRFNALAVTLFASLSLLLIIVAVIGLLAHWVTGRRQEIAVRLALGAMPEAMARNVMLRAGAMLAVAVGLVLIASPLLQALLGNLLYGVSPLNVNLWAAAVVMVSAVTFAATAVPALAAARVAPAEMLRCQ